MISRDCLIICVIIILSQSENSIGVDPVKRCKRNDEKEIRISESRYRLKSPDYAKREYEPTKRHLPVTFRAPHYEAPDYWDYKHEEPDYGHRRTFFEDISYLPYDKRTTFPDFYHFMTSLFRGRGETSSTTPTPEGFHYPRPTPTHSGHYNFRPTEPTYIPPPKPIRASVIKLETIPRSPSIYTFDYDSTTNPHLGSILNHVLIENTKNLVGLYGGHHPLDKAKPTPGLPNPVYDTPPTIKPSSEYSDLPRNQTRGFPPFKPLSDYPKKRNETGYRYPTSVQDQLPPVDLKDIKIPYVSVTPTHHSITVFPSDVTDPRYDGNDYFPHNGPRTAQNFEEIIEIRPLNKVRTPKRGRKRPHSKAVTFIKTPSVEKITNLTVEGLSMGHNENANIHKYINYFNMRNLINYEIGKLGNVGEVQPDKILTETEPKTGNSSSHLVNLNDELSLDAKILKDTNWDGLLSTESIQTTTTIVPEIRRDGQGKATLRKENVIQKIRPKIKKNDFWAVDAEKAPSSAVPATETPEDSTTVETTTATEPAELTTTDSTPIPMTSEATETTPPTTTQEITTEEATSQTQTNATTEPSNVTMTEVPTIIEIFHTTTTTQSIFPKRKYIRRPKITSFTPYPTVGEPHKKSVIRNNFPKRQKPNITLAFGNKNIIKAREGYAGDEVMQFSDEDIRKKKRKVGKRRQLYARTRLTTSQRPDQEEEQ